MTGSHFIFPVITWKNFSIYGRNNTHAPVGGLSEASPEPFLSSFQTKCVWNFYTESTWTCSRNFVCVFWKMKCLLSCYYNNMARPGTNTFYWKFSRKYIGRSKPITPHHFLSGGRQFFELTQGGQSLCEHDHTSQVVPYACKRTRIHKRLIKWMGISIKSLLRWRAPPYIFKFSNVYLWRTLSSSCCILVMCFTQRIMLFKNECAYIINFRSPFLV